jgi:hypothetical protein
MRRGIQGLAVGVAVVLATVTMVTVSARTSGGSRVTPRVLGATMERQTLSSWSAEFALGSPTAPQSTATRSTRTSSRARSSSTTTSVPLSTTTSAPLPTTTVASTAPPSTLPSVASPPAVMSADGLAQATSASAVPPRALAGADVVTRAEGLVYFDWRDTLPGWTIQFVGPRAGMRGATFPRSKIVQVYVRSDESAADVAHAFAHELGHAIDVTYLNDQFRGEFNQARGRPTNFGWWVSAGADDFSSGAGDWAECFAWTMTHGVGGFYSNLGPPPTEDVMGLIGQLDH